MSASANLTLAHRRWASRPDDERYLSLSALHGAMRARQQRSAEVDADVRRLRVGYNGDEVFLADEVGQRVLFTHYAFGQLSQRIHAPAGYMRTLPAPLTAALLQYGLEHRGDGCLRGKEEAAARLLLLLPRNGDDGVLRAATSWTYGRIWDADVVAAVCDVNGDDRWQVPGASYQATDPQRATTLYASDRDIFLFLVDESRPLEVSGARKAHLNRGFITWNSEVGDRTFGLMTFLYDYVCDNRVIWGARDVQQLLIRHTSGGPLRFAQQAAPALRAYSEGSPRALLDAVQAAQTTRVATTPPGVEAWLRERGFTHVVAKASVQLSEQGGDDPTSLWGAVQGLTAYARGIPHQDSRVALERQAGSLLARSA